MQEITPNVNEEKAAAEVHSYIKDMVAKYHHRPIPTTPAAGNVKTYYRDCLLYTSNIQNMYKEKLST